MTTRKMSAFLLTIIVTMLAAGSALASSLDDAADPDGSSSNAAMSEAGSAPATPPSTKPSTTTETTIWSYPSTAPTTVMPPPTTTPGPVLADHGVGDDRSPASAEQHPVATSEVAPAPRPAAPDAVDRAPNPVRSGPIGTFDDHGAVPALGDLVAPHRSTNGSRGHQGPDGLAANPSCAHQCITKGVADAHGSDVELVVETSVPATLLISVTADENDDGNYDNDPLLWHDNVGYQDTSFSFTVEDLHPGETYFGFVAAHDGSFTSIAWGFFTMPS